MLSPKKKSTEKKSPAVFDAVVIGVSAGGIKALETLLPFLPHEYFMPVIIVKHLNPDSDDFLARYLDDKCRLKVKHAAEKEPIMPGTAYLAPPNYHLRIGSNRTFSLSSDNLVNYARPSIDVLFETAAEVYGSGLIGIILTGASSDGTKGIIKIKKAGGMTIVQDPCTAEAQVMPKSAISGGGIDFILSLEAIGRFLYRLSERIS